MNAKQIGKQEYKDKETIYKFRRTKTPDKSGIIRELELYKWHQEYFQINRPNCWSQISKYIKGSTPDMLKNMFYCQAISSLKRIICGMDFQSFSPLEKIRMTYFLLLSQEYLHLTKIHNVRNDHFMNLLTEYKITSDALEKYLSNNTLSENKESLKKRIYDMLSIHHTSTAYCFPNNELIEFPIDDEKKLHEPEHWKDHFQIGPLNLDIANSLTYFLEYYSQLKGPSNNELK